MAPIPSTGRVTCAKFDPLYVLRVWTIRGAGLHTNSVWRRFRSRFLARQGLHQRELEGFRRTDCPGR